MLPLHNWAHPSCHPLFLTLVEPQKNKSNYTEFYVINFSKANSKSTPAQNTGKLVAPSIEKLQLYILSDYCIATKAWGSQETFIFPLEFYKILKNC